MLTRTLVRVYKIVLEIENGMSTTTSVEIASVRLAGFEVKDVKFIDDDEIVLATSDECKLCSPTHSLWPNRLTIVRSFVQAA